MATMTYSDSMKQPSDIIIKYSPAALYSRWQIIFRGVVQDYAATPERAIEAAARIIISNMKDNEDSGSMRIRWVDVPAGFTPPDVSALAPVLEDDEPTH